MIAAAEDGMKHVKLAMVAVAVVLMAGCVATRTVAPPATPAPAPVVKVIAPDASAALQVKWVRDSAEYAALTRQVFRSARAAIARAVPHSAGAATWCAVLDIDETVLDNSVYELEREAYRLPYDPASWAAWVARGRAEAVPGAVEFAAYVHATGGRLAFISNRIEPAREATLANLAQEHLWQEGDLLCLASDAKAYTKEARRKELRAGAGPCSWPGVAPNVVLYLGDQLGDFPVTGEEPEAVDPESFGMRYFLLPDPMYGDWTSKVTRKP